MSNKIKHSGIVECVEPGRVQVRILQTSACAACQAARYCNSTESKEKLVDVYLSDASQYRAGDSVIVTASHEVVTLAMLWAFGVPFALLVVTLVTVLQLTGNEAWAAASGLSILLPYYALLYFSRKRMRETLTFSIE